MFKPKYFYATLGIYKFLPTKLFVSFRDNVYGDFNDVEAKSLLSAYSKLNKNKYFLNLKRNTEIYPIWDDHDYGINDGGKNWPFKKKAQSIFLDFFNINKNEIRRKEKGYIIHGI